MGGLRLDELTVEQIEKVYAECVTADFPPDELRPLSAIRRLKNAGAYSCFGLFDGAEPAGYAFLHKLTDGADYFIDYIATAPHRRNAGLGAALTGLLREKLAGAESIIGEVEDPAFAASEEDRALQTRRRGFYLRNGFRDTGVRVTCFGVPYILLETGEGLCHTEEEIRRLYRRHYRSMLPAHLFEANIIV